MNRESPLSERPHVGKLPPMYHFILNPRRETRVSTCPSCDRRMRQRKVPLFIHVDPVNPVVIGYTCRYCPDCDLLVAHQDEIEALLTGMFAKRDPSVIGNDYLVVGTVERALWREGMKTQKGVGELLENLHDFKEVWKLEYEPGGWYPDEDAAAGKGETMRQEPGPGQKRARKRRGKRPGKRRKRR